VAGCKLSAGTVGPLDPWAGYPIAWAQLSPFRLHGTKRLTSQLCRGQLLRSFQD